MADKTWKYANVPKTKNVTMISMGWKAAREARGRRMALISGSLRGGKREDGVGSQAKPLVPLVYIGSRSKNYEVNIPLKLSRENGAHLSLLTSN